MMVGWDDRGNIAARQWRGQTANPYGVWRLLPAGLVFFLLVPFNLNTQSAPYKIDLPLILEKTAEYCSRLANASLHFVCQEEIKEHLYYSPSAGTIYTGARFYKENKYLYDYQLIRKDGDIQEKRILLEQNGKKR
ncbi:MAG: hypothetical protein OEW05_13315, partial [Candidatus Aminicenantes bacterium]|nr:hypothetical protein [Candidatus Aminicenantes bacterium]